MVKILNDHGDLLYGECLYTFVHLLNEVLNNSAQVRYSLLVDSGCNVFPKLLSDGFRLRGKTGSVLTRGGSRLLMTLLDSGSKPEML